MKKNDKLVTIIGVILLIIAGIGIYTWVPEATSTDIPGIEDFFTVTSSFSDVPDGIAVSEGCPFYPLIATPLAVHYNMYGEQEIAPLYIQNFDNPSRAVTRAMNQISRAVDTYIDDSKTAKEWSIDIAKNYWNHSEAALIIENNESGYNLGVLATPIASYLGIPVIVTDKLDHHVQEALNELGVEKSIVCSENFEGYGSFLKLTTVNEIVNATISIVKEKFGEVNYITITNPIDAWPPEVLGSETWTLGPEKMTTSATTELLTALNAGEALVGKFTIPNDYKYALVKFNGINLHVDDVDELGDSIVFFGGPVEGEIKDAPQSLERFELYAGSTNAGGIPVRDGNGNIIEDLCYNEVVLYDRGGVEYKITAIPTWLATDEGEVKAEITIEKLSDPIYPMMKNLSTIAPYLTAYHKGIIFGKPEFAFTADDDVLFNGEPSPGFYMSRKNPQLTEPSNEHVFEIHEQINDLLAELAGITIDRDYDLKYLREYYKNQPLYIALVGGATVIPQYTYDSAIAPIDPEEVIYYFGGGTPSDFIYGNIDPKKGDMSNQAKDLYSDSTHPYQENIVGRITGWDSQDASALIARTVFYDEIIDDMDEWKENAVLQLGGGNDFRKPFIRYKIFGELLDMIPRGEPMKYETGASYISGLSIQENVLEALGFDTEYIRENQAALQGFTNEAIDKLKKANILNRLLLVKWQLKKEVGEDAVQGGKLQENSNFILANAHGNQHLFGMGDVGMYSLGLGLPNGLLQNFLVQIATITGFGPGFSLSDHGYYSTRNVENMNLGPSFLWIESCICGKIDGVYPKQGISQAYLHSGCNAVIAATTESNIAGGYLEPKNTMYDFPGQTLLRYIRAKLNARQGIYPDLHFGFKMYQDLCSELSKGKNVSLGLALRNARNMYLSPEEVEWELWWSPPLVITGVFELDREIFKNLAAEQTSGMDIRLDNKYITFQEYALYGDPAFVPYIPCNN